MEYEISPLSQKDRQPVIDIFNHYIANSFAAYREEAVPQEMFDLFLNEGAETHPAAAVRSGDGEVIGFGLLSPYKDITTFSHTAVVTYFLHPDAVGRGIGSALLEYLEEKGRGQGVTTLLANISSKNPASLKFHLRKGFSECGRFVRVGRKNDCYFDIVWMQKYI